MAEDTRNNFYKHQSPFEKNRHQSVNSASVKLCPENFSYGLRRVKHTTPSRDAVAQATKILTRKNENKQNSLARPQLN